MSIMTIRLPEDKHKRLKQLARAQHVSVNKLIEDFTTTAYMAGLRRGGSAFSRLGRPWKILKRALSLLDRVDSAAKNIKR